MTKAIKINLTCRSKTTKIKEKEEDDTTSYSVFMQNEAGDQMTIHTESAILQDSFTVGIDYEFKATKPQKTLDG